MLAAALLFLPTQVWAQLPDAAPTQSPDEPADSAFEYDSIATNKAPLNKIEQRRLDEAAEFARREQGCAAGVVETCGELGESYELGIGAEQNRPIAAILYTEACEAGDAASCVRLGRVSRAKFDQDAGKEQAFAAYEKACDLGSLEGCALVGQAYRLGDGVEPDPARAEAIAIQTCQRGGALACLDSALFIKESDPEQVRREEMIALFYQACQGGVASGCTRFLDDIRYNGALPFLPTEAEILRLGCDAEHALSCERLGDIAFRGDGYESDIGEALRLYDRVCYLEPLSCGIASDVRAAPLEYDECHAGNIAACARLAELYDQNQSPLHNPEMARGYYEYACTAGATEACASAARTIMGAETYLDRALATQAMAYLERGCAADHLDACYQLAQQLKNGTHIPQDMQRHYQLLVRLCENGSVSICEDLEREHGSNPDVPLIQAGARFLPPLDENDPRATDIFMSDEEREAVRTRCTVSEIEFRGKVYKDRVCNTTPLVIGGRAMRPGEAPWQALIWRPRRAFDQVLSGRQRVLCGGSLIARGWVLTAAHCLRDDDGSILGRGYSVRLGVSNPRQDEGVTFPIIEIHEHDKYDPANDYVFDIALIRYDPSAGRSGAATNSIAFISLDDSRAIRRGQSVYVYGWGWTNEVNSGSTAQLRGARLLLEDPDVCTGITGFEDEFRNAAICAAGRNRESSCKGDSGGPLIIYDGRPRLIGVVNAGRACGQAGEPSRFTRVHAAREWIDRTMQSSR